MQIGSSHSYVIVYSETLYFFAMLYFHRHFLEKTVQCIISGKKCLNIDTTQNTCKRECLRVPFSANNKKSFFYSLQVLRVLKHYAFKRVV